MVSITTIKVAGQLLQAGAARTTLQMQKEVQTGLGNALQRVCKCRHTHAVQLVSRIALAIALPAPPHRNCLLVMAALTVASQQAGSYPRGALPTLPWLLQGRLR